MRWSKTRTFGQHYLADKSVLREIIESSQISREEVVCEVGTGEGILTQELCKHAKRVISFETDKALYLRALNYLSGFSNLLLMHSDIFKSSGFEFDVFVSNLPYSRSKDAIEWLALKKFNRAIIMLQREFVDKLQARAGEANYRSISVIGQYCFRIENLFEVNRTSFTPQPRVKSQVVRLTPKGENHLIMQTLNNINYIFSRRNKKAASVLKALGRKEFCYHNWNDKRIDQLAPEELVVLAQSITKK